MGLLVGGLALVRMLVSRPALRGLLAALRRSGLSSSMMACMGTPKQWQVQAIQQLPFSRDRWRIGEDIV
jgi:hypothetical protein